MNFSERASERNRARLHDNTGDTSQSDQIAHIQTDHTFKMLGKPKEEAFFLLTYHVKFTFSNQNIPFCCIIAPFKSGGSKDARYAAW